MSALKMSGLGGHRNAGLLITRVIIGAIMLAHGWQKVFDMGPDGFAAVLGSLGVPAPGFMTYVVMGVEIVGGAFLILGLFSRLSALLLTINLIVAILTVKLGVGLIAAPGSGAGAELDLALIAGFVTVLFSGPGSYSLDGADSAA